MTRHLGNLSFSIRSWLGAAHERLYYLLVLLFPATFFLSIETAKTFRDLIALLFLLSLFRWKGWVRLDSVIGPALLVAAVIIGGYVWHIYNVPPEILGGSQARTYIVAFGFFIMMAYGSIVWKRIPPLVFLLSAAIGL